MNRIPKYFLPVLLVGIFFASFAVTKAIGSNTDIWNLSGQGIYNAKDMAHVDNGYNLRLYNGGIYLGDNQLTPTTSNTQTTPSTTVGGYYGIHVPYLNGNSGTITQGMVILSSGTNTSTTQAVGNFAAVLATTSVLGIADGTCASGAVCTMTVSGYALIATTGTVLPGQLLISTGTTAGFTGPASGTTVVGTVIGKALTVGAAAGSLVLAIVNQQ